MWLFPNEIPSGAINWVNKIYTTANNIWTVVDLMVDWAEYYDFTSTWTTLTLVDAPTLSIRIDYYDTGTIPTPGSDTVTLWDIITKIWDEMVQKSTSTTYNREKLVNMVNEVWQQITDKQVYNELTNNYIQVSDLPFVNDITAFTIIDNPTLTTAVAVWDTEIGCTTTDLDASGAIMLWWEVITYAAKTATEITGVSGILLAHDAGETVQKLYTAPSNFGKPLKFYKMSAWEEIEIKWKRESDSLVKYYNTITFWDEIYIITTSNVQGGYYLKYAKSYTTLVGDTDTAIYPIDVAMNWLVFICAGRLIKDPDLRMQLLTKWYGNLTVSANKYNNQSGKSKKPRWKRFWFSSIQ